MSYKYNSRCTQCPYCLPDTNIRDCLSMIIRSNQSTVNPLSIFGLSVPLTRKLLVALIDSLQEFNAIKSIEKLQAHQIAPSGLQDKLDSLTRKNIEDVASTKLLLSLVLFGQLEVDQYSTDVRKIYEKVLNATKGVTSHECHWILIWSLIMNEISPAKKSPPKTPSPPPAAPTGAQPSADSNVTCQLGPPANTHDTPRSDKSGADPSLSSNMSKQKISSKSVNDATKMHIPEITTIPDFDTHHFANISCERAEQIYCANSKIGDYINLLDHPQSEKDLSKNVTLVFLEIAKGVKTDYGLIETGNQVPIGGIADHRFDFCMLDKSSIPELAANEQSRTELKRHTGVKTSFDLVHALGELKVKKSSENKIRYNNKPLLTEVQLGQYVLDVFRNQNFRRHVYGFTLHGNFMRILLFDHCGACSSDSFDVVLSPYRLVRVMASLLTMKREELGYDPTYSVLPCGRQTLSMTDNGDVYELGSSLHTPNTFAGRATAVWKAKKIAGTGSTVEKGATVIIKDSWQSVGRAEEGKMLQNASSNDASLFPDGLDPSLQSSHHIGDWPKPPRFSEYLHHEKVKQDGSVVDVYHKIRRMPRPLEVDPEAAPTHSKCFRAVCDYDENANREQRRVVVKYKHCVKIQELNSLLDLFTAIRDCVDGHWALYQSGVLHRDISKDNLMAAVMEINPGVKTQTPITMAQVPVVNTQMLVAKGPVPKRAATSVNSQTPTTKRQRGHSRQPQPTPQPTAQPSAQQTTRLTVQPTTQKTTRPNTQPATQSQTLAKNFRLEHGFIIDLDLAADADLSTRVACGAPFATGNKLFMAREVLESMAEWQLAVQNGHIQDDMDFGSFSRFKQEYRHDIESFYWVLLLCIFRMERSGKRNIQLTFEKWAVDDYHRVFGGKAGYFLGVQRGTIRFEDMSPSELTAKAFSAQLVSFSMILADLDYLKNLEPVELYCRFQRGLTEMIDFLKKV